MPHRKKLIEVALPLEAINHESAREKSIRHGHPSTLHLWWARRPLAACRAVLWASLVDDPSSWPDKFPTKAEQDRERQRLFDILGRVVTQRNGREKEVVKGLVSWDDVNAPNSGVLEQAQREIARCLAWERGEEPPTDAKAVRDYIAKYAPPVYDPFAGGGSIPLEAQRLGLRVYASDLNPVAVLINKALTEIPARFKDRPPVSLAPEQRMNGLNQWHGAQGLAADVRYYGQWMRDEAFERIGHLYPKVRLNHGDTEDTEATVIAWLWARTVTCPNPACRCQMPLVKSFQLSTKKGKEAWVEPMIHRGDTENTEQENLRDLCASVVPKIQFVVKDGNGQPPDGTVNRRGARCIACGTPVPLEDIRQEGRAGRMGAQLMAIVAEGPTGRLYLSPDAEHERIAASAQPSWQPKEELQGKCRVSVPLYGMNTFADLFTPRQLVALTTLSDLVKEAQAKATQDAIAAGLPDDNVPLNEGGTGARAYGEAIATYLGFLVDQMANHQSNACRWEPGNQQMHSVFARQAIPMVWDFAESNPFCKSSGSFNNLFERMLKGLKSVPAFLTGQITQHDATAPHPDDNTSKLISTDPPYYDNIGYADLSDFFYVWLRRSIGSVYPDLFSTLLTPKAEELVATPYRFGGSKQQARTFFQAGLSKAFRRMYNLCRDDYPLTIYYAFRQQEEDPSPPNPLSPCGRGGEEGRASTGWETMLEGLIQAGFTIDGTWPMRSELSNRMVASGTNALASSIVLVCRRRPADAPKATRRQFLTELQRELPPALHTLQQGNIAPVDLAQAAIGPGMAVYSRYTAILESDGTPLTVRTALQLINQYLDEYFSEQEGEFDSETRWAITWFTQHQFEPGPYGDAETLSKAKNTSVQGMVEAGILEAKGGNVRLLPREALLSPLSPRGRGAGGEGAISPGGRGAGGEGVNHWLITQALIHALDQQGETGAAALLAKLGDNAAIARDLAYRLYSLCDKQGWSQEAIAYNSLVISWPEITRLAAEAKTADIQTALL